MKLVYITNHSLHRSAPGLIDSCRRMMRSALRESWTSLFRVSRRLCCDAGYQTCYPRSSCSSSNWLWVLCALRLAPRSTWRALFNLSRQCIRSQRNQRPPTCERSSLERSRLRRLEAPIRKKKTHHGTTSSYEIFMKLNVSRFTRISARAF